MKISYCHKKRYSSELIKKIKYTFEKIIYVWIDGSKSRDTTKNLHLYGDFLHLFWFSAFKNIIWLKEASFDWINKSIFTFYCGGGGFFKKLVLSYSLSYSYKSVVCSAPRKVPRSLMRIYQNTNIMHATRPTVFWCQN